MPPRPHFDGIFFAQDDYGWWWVRCTYCSTALAAFPFLPRRKGWINCPCSEAS